MAGYLKSNVENSQELLAALQERADSTVRRNFNINDAEFKVLNDDVRLVIRDEPFVLTDGAFDTLCKTLDIPKAYAKRCDPDFQATTFNHWAHAQNDTAQSVLVTKGQVRSFIDPSYSYVPSLNVFNAVVEELNTIEGEQGVDLSKSSFYLDDNVLETNIITGDWDTEVLDSPIRAGIRLVHSDAWAVFPRFDAYLWRLVCSNGMVEGLDNMKFRVSGKNEQEIITNVRSYVAQSIEKIPAMIEGFAALANHRVEALIPTIRRIAKEWNLSQKVVNILIEVAQGHPFLSTISNREIRNMNDLVNLFTYVGSHNDQISPAVRERLLEIGGALTLDEHHRCVSCGTVVD